MLLEYVSIAVQKRVSFHRLEISRAGFRPDVVFRADARETIIKLGTIPSRLRIQFSGYGGMVR